MLLSSSTIIGDDVKNNTGDDLGKIEDLMVDLTTGKVAYAVLSFGGFLHLGNKLFAVPLQALKVNTNGKYFSLNESKERLENAPGFDKDNWPDFADASWQKEVHGYYGL